MLSYNLQFVFC